ncbi:MAG: immune inhibitor A, partial [Anaerolineales bacterium]|nr:immune inhibitor A [Anaerolineales bacterium]
MKKKYYSRIFAILFLGPLLAGCGSPGSDISAPCEEKQVLFCEDFEGISPDLGESQLVSSTAFDQWWGTTDNDQEYLFLDFPVSGRSRTNMILLGDGYYKSQSSSFLYTVEIDLSTSTRADLQYNLIYRTEKHWDGLVVFAVKGGIEGAGSENNWMMLTPRGGYPDTILFNGTIIPGYSGTHPYWIHETIDLDPVLGGKFVVGFYFVADDVLEDWGI